MNENLCIAIITTASIFAGFLVAFLSSYLTARNKEYDENKKQFDALGRKLTLFRQLCGFIWYSNCLEKQRRNIKANEPAFDEDGYVKSFMHAIDALHRDLHEKLYKQYPNIDYSKENLDVIKTLVNSIWYELIHNNIQDVHFSPLLHDPMGISPGYFATMRKELSFGNSFSDEGMDDSEFGTIAGHVECEVIEDMEALQYKMHKRIDTNVVEIVKFTIRVSASGIVVPLLLLWAKDCFRDVGWWNNLILFIVLVFFLYSIAMSAKHMYRYFQKKETTKGIKYNFKQMVNNSNHEQKFDKINNNENAFKEFYENAPAIFDKLQKSDSSSQFFKDRCYLQVFPGGRAGDCNSDVVEVSWGLQPVKKTEKKNGFDLHMEEGVAMFFDFLPNGRVLIRLYLAKIDNMRPFVDYIILHKSINATWLQKERNQKTLWRDFMACTECTSLVGTPSIRQKLIMLWLKYTHPICVNGIQMPIRVWQGLKRIVIYGLTVALSGCLLYIIQQYQKEEVKDYSPLIEQTNQCIEGVQEVQGELLKEIQSVNAKIDSLMKPAPLRQKKS